MDIFETRSAYQNIEEKETGLSEEKSIKQTIDVEKKKKTKESIDEIKANMVQIETKMSKIEEMLSYLLNKKSKKHKKNKDIG